MTFVFCENKKGIIYCERSFSYKAPSVSALVFLNTLPSRYSFKVAKLKQLRICTDMAPFGCLQCRGNRETTKENNCTAKRIVKVTFSSTMLPSPPDLGRVPTSELATRTSIELGFWKSFRLRMSCIYCRVKWSGAKFLIDCEIRIWLDRTSLASR